MLLGSRSWATPFDWRTSHAWGTSGLGRPWLTWALLATLVAVYTMEKHVAIAIGHGRPDTAVLVLVGGVSRHLVLSGEAYRLFSAPFLHANASHLVSNSIAFILVGSALERVLGPVSTFCVFALGGVAGTLGSIVLNKPDTVSVGASGSIMAMLLTLLLASLGMPPGRERRRVLVRSMWIMATAVLPAGHGTTHVDYAAHFGGALLGAGYGLLLLRTRDCDWRAGRLAAGENTAAALAMCLVLLSAGTLAWRFPTHVAPSAMIPDGMLARNKAEIALTAADLRAAYPNDPRSHLFEAQMLLVMNNKPAAERELRAAMQLAEAGHAQFRPTLVNLIRGVLAATLAEDGQVDEARVVAKAACTASDDTAPPPSIMTLLMNEGACGPS